MNYNYPPDADYQDCFRVEEHDLATALVTCDEQGKESALSFLRSVGLGEARAEDLLEWFGR